MAFIGPCAAKKLEASRRTIRSDVDFVLTFEELQGMFEAKGIRFEDMEDGESMKEATSAGRGYAVTGGVAKAVADMIHQLAPDRQVQTAYADGLNECRKMLKLAKAGKYNGYLLEGMGCPGGCVAGAGIILPVKKAQSIVAKYQTEATTDNPLDSDYVKSLESLNE